jgi:hypothetical protein
MFRARSLVIETKGSERQTRSAVELAAAAKLARSADAFATDQFANRVRRRNASV